MSVELKDLIDNIIKKKSVKMYDVLDDEDSIVGKFFIANSKPGKAFIISMQKGVLTIYNICGFKRLIVVERNSNLYNFVLNILDLDKSLLIDLYKFISRFV